jgi:hypothetical protein
MKDAALVKWDAGIGRKKTERDCAASFHIPNMTDWWVPVQ